MTEKQYITYVSEDDIKIIKKNINIRNVNDVIYLYHKYLDPNANICNRCKTEINIAFERFLYHYKKYLENTNE